MYQKDHYNGDPNDCSPRNLKLMTPNTHSLKTHNKDIYDELINYNDQRIKYIQCNVDLLRKHNPEIK